MHLSACIWSVNLTYRIDDICWILEVKAFQFGVCGQRWGSETLGLGRWYNPTRLRFNNVDILPQYKQKVLSGLHLVFCQSKTKHYLKTALLQYMAIRFMSTLRGSQQLSSCERK